MDGRRAGADDSDSFAVGGVTFRPGTGVVELAFEVFETWEVRCVGTVKEAGTADQVSTCGSVALLSLDRPDMLVRIPRSLADTSMKVHIFSQIEHVVDVGHVLSQLDMIGKALGKVPAAINLRDVELVERRFTIHSRAGISIPIPHPTEIAPGLEALDSLADLTESVDGRDAAEAGAHHQHIAFYIDLG